MCVLKWFLSKILCFKLVFLLVYLSAKQAYTNRNLTDSLVDHYLFWFLLIHVDLWSKKYKMLLIFTKELKLILEIGNGMNFSYFLAVHEKTFFTKCFSFDSRGLKWIFKTEKGISKTGKGIFQLLLHNVSHLNHSQSFQVGTYLNHLKWDFFSHWSLVFLSHIPISAISSRISIL